MTTKTKTQHDEDANKLYKSILKNRLDTMKKCIDDVAQQVDSEHLTAEEYSANFLLVLADVLQRQVTAFTVQAARYGGNLERGVVEANQEP